MQFHSLIRPATGKDTQALLDIYAPYVQHTAVTFEYDVPSKAEFAQRIRTVQQRYPYLVAEDNGALLGYAYASSFHSRAAYDWCVECSIYLRMDCRRKGIGSRLYSALESELAGQGFLNLNACIACPPKEDEHLTMDSIHFHTRMGYRMVGKFHQCGYKFNRWYDMVWMEKHIGPHLANQPSVAHSPAYHPSGNDMVYKKNQHL